MTFHVPEEHRWKFPPTHPLYSDVRDGNNGMFRIKLPNGTEVRVVASDGRGWEHASVSLPNRAPLWKEMCWVKELFWDEEDMVVQYHPPKSQYVNFHPFCLHLWRPTGFELQAPPSILVGPTP